MALSPELQQLITDIHNFLTLTLATEGLSENTEDRRAELVVKLSPYTPQLLAVNTTAQLTQSMSGMDVLRSKTVSTFGGANTLPEPPKAPPPGEAKKVNPKDLKSTTLYEGPIQKLGGKNQEKWQNRYCILTRTYLYFFENAKCKHQNNQIYIPAFTISPVKERGNEKHLAFRLSSATMSKNTKSYYFRVQEQDTYAKWYSCITQVSANKSTLGVNTAVPRAETMVFNIENISPTSSSDETETTQRTPSPPPVPPPTTSIPKSPQFLRKTTPTSVPTATQQQQPTQLIVPQPPASEPATDPVKQVQPPVDSVINQNNDLNAPPPTPVRSGSVLNPGPGVSVQHMRKLLTSKRDSAISEGDEGDEENREVMVDTDKVYETTDEEDFPYDKIYAAKWDFRGDMGDELTFKRGDLILVADPSALATWWIGDLLHLDTLKAKDQSGLFYSAYVEPAFVKV